MNTQLTAKEKFILKVLVNSYFMDRNSKKMIIIRKINLDGVFRNVQHLLYVNKQEIKDTLLMDIAETLQSLINKGFVKVVMWGEHNGYEYVEEGHFVPQINLVEFNKM